MVRVLETNFSLPSTPETRDSPTTLSKAVSHLPRTQESHHTTSYLVFPFNMSIAEKKETFRKYLETSGVIDALTKSEFLRFSLNSGLAPQMPPRAMCLRRFLRSLCIHAAHIGHFNMNTMHMGTPFLN